MTKQTTRQLQAKITQLQQEKEQLRVLLHELIEAFYKSTSQKEPSTTWTFNPDLEALFKNLANFKSNCSHQPTNSKFTYNGNNFQPNECGWTQMQDIFAKMKGEHE